MRYNHTKQRKLRKRERLSSVQMIVVLLLALAIGLGLNSLFCGATRLKAAETKCKKSDTIIKGKSSGLDGSGRSSDPWLIRSSEDLEYVRQAIAAGNSFKGEYLELTTDLQLPA